MKIAYVTAYDNRTYDLKNWSGIGYYIARGFQAAGIEVAYIGPLESPHSWIAERKNELYPRLQGKRYLKERSPRLYQHYARQINRALKAIPDVDIVFGQGCNPIAYLDCK